MSGGESLKCCDDGALEDFFRKFGYSVSPVHAFGESPENITNGILPRRDAQLLTPSYELRGSLTQQLQNEAFQLRDVTHMPLIEDDLESSGSDSDPAFKLFLNQELSVSCTPVPSIENAVPCIHEKDLGDFSEIIGYGGDRGSFVCRVDAPNIRPWKNTVANICNSGEAYKRYPTEISTDELSFITAASQCFLPVAQDEVGLSFPQREERYAAAHLVLPDAVVCRGEEKVGVLMPLFNCSLKEFLQRIMCRKGDEGIKLSGEAAVTCTATSCSSNSDELTADSEHCSGFRSTQSYSSITSVKTLVAVLFQVLEAITCLHDRLPHGEGRTGFTHNDIHLENILLTHSGLIALCDFELVASTPPMKISMALRRLPPTSRQSPNGLFNETADIWAFGILIINLLTGVDPVFSSSISNDFSNAPQLCRWDRAERVLDWEANISAHVNRLLVAQDPTGYRQKEVQGLLHLCSLCLVNRKNTTAMTAAQLLQQPIFSSFRSDFGSAERVVREWIELQQKAMHSS